MSKDSLFEQNLEHFGIICPNAIWYESVCVHDSCHRHHGQFKWRLLAIFFSLISANSLAKTTKYTIKLNLLCGYLHPIQLRTMEISTQHKSYRLLMYVLVDIFLLILSCSLCPFSSSSFSTKPYNIYHIFCGIANAIHGEQCKVKCTEQALCLCVSRGKLSAQTKILANE